MSEQSNDVVDLKQLESRLSDPKYRQNEENQGFQHRASAGPSFAGPGAIKRSERTRGHYLSQEIETADKQILQPAAPGGRKTKKTGTERESLFARLHKG